MLLTSAVFSERISHFFSVVLKVLAIEMICDAFLKYLLLPWLDLIFDVDNLTLLGPILLVLLSTFFIVMFVIRPYRLQNIELVKTDTHARKQLEEKLILHSTRDVLTGLFNRRVLTDKLAQLANDTNLASESRYALLLIDLDKFKQVNDTLGHNAGDELLVQFATRLTSICSDQDVLCRLGGDEFAILHRFVSSQSDYQALANTILTAMVKPFLISGVAFQASLSMGMVEITERHTEAVAVLRDADIALYQAKSDTNVRAKKFELHMRADTDKLFTLTQDIKQAIKLNELSIHYQPIMDIDNNEMIGAEALLRWSHLKYGDISPDYFIAIAEHNGFISELFKFVLHGVCRLLSSIGNQLDEYFFISINMSGQQFIFADLELTIVQAIATYNVHPRRLRIELRESAFVDHQTQICDTLYSLIKRGFSIVLDDFGTGYTSINLLYQLPFSFLKIDRTCVRDIVTEIACQRLFEGMVSLANIVGVCVIVEGIETEEQAAYMKKVGIQYVQGYLYSKPLPLDNFLTFLSDNKSAVASQLLEEEIAK